MTLISALFTGTSMRLFTSTIKLSFKKRIAPRAVLTGFPPVPKYPMISLAFSSAREVAGNPIAQQRINMPASSMMTNVRFVSASVNCMSDNSETTPLMVMRNGDVNAVLNEINCVTHIGASGGRSDIVPRYGEVGFAAVVTDVPHRDPTDGVE